MSHCPPEEWLVDVATGADASSVAFLVACHLELCPTCSHTVRELRMSGGALLAALQAERTELSELEGALMAKLDDALAAPVDVPPDPIFPRPLTAWIGPSATAPWQRYVPGIQRIVLDRASRTLLLRFAPGVRPLPHRHVGLERTLVLDGGYRDPRHGEFRRGFVQIVGDEVHEQVMDDDGCIALFVNDGPLIPTTWLGRVASWFVET